MTAFLPTIPIPIEVPAVPRLITKAIESKIGMIKLCAIMIFLKSKKTEIMKAKRIGVSMNASVRTQKRKILE